MIPHSKPFIDSEDFAHVSRVLAGGMIAKGGLAAELEQAIADKVGVASATLTTSGTAALVFGLKALGIGQGDGVVVPSYVCRNVLDAVQYVGAKPQICDVDELGVITKTTAKVALDDSSKAIIAVHIFGNACDISSLKDLRLPILEDACQAFGVNINGQPAGSLGDIGFYSFHATKLLTTGEGGMLVCSRPDLIAAVEELKIRAPRRPEIVIGTEISDLQCALGLAQLARFDEFVIRRRAVFNTFKEAIEARNLKLCAHSDSSWSFRFVVRHNSTFDDVELQFRQREISARRGVDQLLHRLTGLSDEAFPGAVDLFDSVVSVPFYPALDQEEIAKIEHALMEVNF